MMKMKEFTDYLKDNIKEYLPSSYEDARIEFKETIKNGDLHLTGMMIIRPDENIVPTIYVNQMFEHYLDGRDIEDIIGEIADIRIMHESDLSDTDILDQISDYEQVKSKLQIRLCDTKENLERLEGLVHYERSDFSATYHVIISASSEQTASMAVTPEFIERWGISMEQLHKDALAADMNRQPILSDMLSVMEEMVFGKEPTNLLLEPEKENHMNDVPMYCLTNHEKWNGAGLIMQDDVMDRISEIVGGNYYILPSSIHELLIVPDSGEIEVDALVDMVFEVNTTQVSPADRLSDHVQYYDKASRALENAQKRVERLEMEKKEKASNIRPRSIHDKIKDNKQFLKDTQRQTFTNTKSKTNGIAI